MIYLPNIETKTADALVGVFEEDELLCAIAYLELVYTGKLIPGPELFRLGIDALEYTDQELWELWAVQNRCALAIQKNEKIATQNSQINPRYLARYLKTPMSQSTIIEFAVRSRTNKILQQAHRDRYRKQKQ